MTHKTEASQPVDNRIETPQEKDLINPILTQSDLEMPPYALNKFLAKSGIQKYQGLEIEHLNSAKDDTKWQEVENVVGQKLDKFIQSDVVLFPYHNVRGENITKTNGDKYVRVRFINETPEQGKYRTPLNEANHLYFTRSISPELWAEVMEDRTIPLILVEGEKKCEYLNQVLTVTYKPLAVAIGISGVWNWTAPKATLNLRKGTGLFLDAMKNSPNEGVRTSLKKLEGAEREEIMEVLNAWYEMESLNKATKTKSNLTIENRLSDWYFYKSTNRQCPGYLDGLEWNLEDKLEELKKTLTEAKFASVKNSLEKSLKVQEDDTPKYTLSPELTQFKLFGRTVLICFDSDIINSPIGSDGHYREGVAGAARSLSLTLMDEKAKPKLMLLPTPAKFISADMAGYSDRTDKMGADDYGVEYGDDAVRALVSTSIVSNQAALVVNPNEPLHSRNYIHTYKLNLQVSDTIYLCWLENFIRYRVNLAYRDNDSTYQWNGQYWRKEKDEFRESAISEAYLQAVTGKQISITKNQVLKRIRVDDSLWNNKADTNVLYANGSYDFSLGIFVKGFDRSDYCTFSPITAMYKDRHEFKPDTLKTLVEYINYYSGDDERFLQYLLAAIRWTVAPKSTYQKLPIEKFFDLVGHQGSGKSTMLDMIQRAVGLDNCHKFTKDRLGTPEGLHQYVDRKMLFNSDVSGMISKEAAENINMMVSGETVETRALFKQSRQVKMQPVIWLAGNEILNFGITGTQGLSRRLVTIPIERNKGLEVDDELAAKLCSEEFQSALFWLYRQLDETDMKSILNHTRYLPITIVDRTIKQGKEQNPLREFWEHLDSKWSSKDKQGFTREQLMQTFKTWADLNNQTEYKVQKIIVHMKDIEAVSPKLNDKGVQYTYSGTRYFIIHPYKDHTTSDLRLTYDRDNGRPIVIINPTDYLYSPKTFLERILALPESTVEYVFPYPLDIEDYD